MERIIHWFSKNHVAANFLMLIVLLLGLSTWFQIRKEIFPETSIGLITVQIPYPSATPEEVERGVVIPVEEAVQGLDGIERMTSTAVQNIGVVSLEVESDYDVQKLLDEVKAKVDAIDQFAENSEKPIYQEVLLKNQVLNVAVSADVDEKGLRELAEKVRDELLLLEEVSQAEVAGIRPYEISIEVSELQLRELGLTIDQVSQLIRRSSIDLPGGSLKTEAGEVLIRTEGKKYTASDFGKISLVTKMDGSVLRLGDIAKITDGFAEVDLDTSFDGRPAILVKVFRTGNEDTLKIAQAIKTFINEESKQVFPEGVDLEIWKDDSTFLAGRLALLGKNGITGLILVFIVLALFLRPSLALLVSIGIPVSFAGAVLVMPYTGISINMISLFAFILVLGIVVDDAIVVGENVFSRMRKGEDPKDAAPRGTHEVGVVVIFGILTTAVAFTPMLGLSGVSGKIWPNIPLIVIPTLLFSLVQSKLVLPAHLALLPKLDPNREVGAILNFQRKFSRGLESFVDNYYRPFLKIALGARYIVLLLFVCMLVLTVSVIKNKWIKFIFFPKVEADIFSAVIELDKGVAFKETKAVIKKIEQATVVLDKEFGGTKEEPFLVHTLASAGNQPLQTGFDGVGGVPTDTNIGQVTCELLPSAKRPKVSAEDVVSRWRELVGPIPGAVVASFATESAGGGNAIDLELAGADEAQLEAATNEVMRALRNYDGIIDISSSSRPGRRQLELDVLPRGEAMGLRLSDIARQVRQGFYGEEVQTLQRGRDEVKVMVRYPKEERVSLADLNNMKITTATGSRVPFSEVAKATFGRGNSTIRRAERQRSVTITADIDRKTGVNSGEVVADMLNTETGTLGTLSKKYPTVRYQFQGEQKDQRQSMSELTRGLGLALLIMYVLMAIPLSSYVQPLIIMSVIPFGIVGAVIGHIFMRTDLSIMSMCGIVALSGVVVNDSLVLVDYVNRWRKKGGKIIDAAIEAGTRRFRPILLTSLTTFAGLSPMLLETDMQAQFLIPMAISLGFGILFATLITLILVPCIYVLLEDVRRFFSKKK